MLLVACTKSSGPALSVSTFNITYNGKTYNESTDSPSSPYGSLFANIDTGGLGILNGSGCFIGFVSSGIKAYFVGESYAEITTGNYKVLGDGYIINYNDSNKTYKTTLDTTGIIVISADDSRHMAGTFTCKLQNNGIIYPATGSFDILK